MDAVLVGVRVALSVVFAVGAVRMLFDLAGSRTALEEFGVPARFVAPAAITLAGLELAAAALLLIASTAQAGAALAALLPIAAMLPSRRRGAPPDWVTLARNAALTIAAVFVLAAGPGPGIPDWVSHADGTTVALVVMGVVTIVLGYAALSLWRRNRMLTGRGHAPAVPVALEIGQAVPDVTLVAQDGTGVATAELLGDQRRAIFVFTDAGCEPCAQFLPELARWREALRERIDIQVLAAGDEEQNRRLAAEHAIPVLLDRENAAARAFGIGATPGAVEVDAARRVAAPTAIGAPAIEGLIRAALERPAQAQGLEPRSASGNVGARPAGAAS
jgi:peroxiredoxin/uncharacterized membrane protein YphA (DoxX/SURF4 family)